MQRLEVPFREARLCVVRTLLQLFRNTHGVYVPDKALGADSDLTLIVVAIFIGHAEGKPFFEQARGVHRPSNSPCGVVVSAPGVLERPGGTMRKNRRV